MKTLLAFLIVLALPQGTDKPKQLTADQYELLRAKLESGFEREYGTAPTITADGKIIPGVKVKVFARGVDYAVIFYPPDKSEPIVHLLAIASLSDDPKIVMTGRLSRLR